MRTRRDLGYALLLLKQTGRPAARDAGADRRSPRIHDPERAGAVLVVPHHGGCSASTSSRCSRFAFWLSAVQRLERYRWFLRAGVLRAAAAMGRDRARLDRRRVRPPAVGDRRRAADVSRRSSATAPSNVALSLDGLRRVLHRARDRRRLPDGADDSARARRPGLLAAGRAGERRAPRRGGALRRSAMLDYETLRVIWWLLLGVLLIGFAVMDGFDLGVAALLPRGSARDDDERRAVLDTDRARLGRQPGLADPRRRRGVRRVAAALCRVVLRLLPRDVAGAARADPAAGRLHLPQQARGSALAQCVGLGAVRRREPCRR